MFKSWRMRLSAGAAILMVLGLTIGWLMAEDSSDATKLAAPAEIWKDPTLQRTDTAKLQASLAQHSLWGDAGPAAAGDAAKAGASSWKLIGIYAADGPPIAVILVTEAGVPAPKVQNHKKDDELPDGSHIVEITKTTMTVDGANGPRQVRLFFPN